MSTSNSVQGNKAVFVLMSIVVNAVIVDFVLAVIRRQAETLPLHRNSLSFGQ